MLVIQTLECKIYIFLNSITHAFKVFFYLKHRYLKDGNRLLKPELCPHSIFEVMSSCWLKNYEARPTFSQLKTQLGQFISQVNYR